MKLKVTKSMVASKFQVYISATDFTEEERKLFAKFGDPLIDISPIEIVLQRNPLGRPIKTTNFVSLSTLKILNIFEKENEANAFTEKISLEVKNAMEILRTKKDSFSGEQIVEI